MQATGALLGYGMVESFELMSAGAGFVMRLGAERSASSIKAEKAFRDEVASACRHVGVGSLAKAASSLECERAEFYYAIPKILEARAFELGLMP